MSSNSPLLDALIIFVGKAKNASLNAEIQEYQKRLTRHAKVELVPVKDHGDPKRDASALMATLRKNPGRTVIALSEEGALQSSQAFAQSLTKGRKFAFLIGGPTGLAREVKDEADLLVSLSPMTFTHEMAQYILMEQLYRAVSIRINSKYHKG